MSMYISTEYFKEHLNAHAYSQSDTNDFNFKHISFKFSV